MLRGSINHMSGVRIEMYQSFKMPCEIALGKYTQRASVCRSVSPVDRCARVWGAALRRERHVCAARKDLDRPPVVVVGAHRCAAVLKLRQPLMHLLTSSTSQLPTRGTAAEHELHTLSSLCVSLSKSHIHFLSRPVCV